MQLPGMNAGGATERLLGLALLVSATSEPLSVYGWRMVVRRWYSSTVLTLWLLMHSIVLGSIPGVHLVRLGC